MLPLSVWSSHETISKRLTVDLPELGNNIRMDLIVVHH
jgi:hypothetical protein